MNGSFVGTEQSPVNAYLRPLADNGDGFLTHLPSSRSPLIDAGRCFNGNGTRDARGRFNEGTNSRIYTHANVTVAAGKIDGCDIGALEVYKDEIDDTLCFPVKTRADSVSIICI